MAKRYKVKTRASKNYITPKTQPKLPVQSVQLRVPWSALTGQVSRVEVDAFSPEGVLVFTDMFYAAGVISGEGIHENVIRTFLRPVMEDNRSNWGPKEFYVQEIDEHVVTIIGG